MKQGTVGFMMGFIAGYKGMSIIWHLFYISTIVFLLMSRT